jgi:hypothetical protein
MGLGMSPYVPLVQPRTIDEIFVNRRYVNKRMIPKGFEHSRDPYRLGPNWYHLDVPDNIEKYHLMPSQHIDGVWNTTFVQLHPDVEPFVMKAIFWPPSGFSIIHTPKGPWVTATGRGMIGGCAICYLKE